MRAGFRLTGARSSKLHSSRFHSRSQLRKGRPARWRSRVTAKAGCPGALASSAADGPGSTAQRVSAELGLRSPETCTMKSVTPVRCAASSSLRPAVRSSARGDPQISISTAPSAAQERASTPARSTPGASLARMRIRRFGSSPSSRRPGAWSAPISASRQSCRTQTIGRLPEALSASAVANPAVAAAWLPLRAWSSCTAPRARPPSASSIRVDPRRNDRCFWRVAPSIAARRRRKTDAFPLSAASSASGLSFSASG